MAERADVLIHWYSDSPELQAVLTKLKRPFKFVGMPAGPGTSYRKQYEALGPDMIRQICWNRFGTSFQPLRVCVIGFSEGCTGVLNALSSRNAKFLDGAMAIDGIFAKWVPESKKTMIDSSYLAPWKAFAKLAAQDGRMAIITASSIETPWPSAATCAEWVWQQVAGPSPDTSSPRPPAIWQAPVVPPFINPEGCLKDANGNPGICWPRREYLTYPTSLYRQRGGFVVANYANLDPRGIGDHRLQAARVLPLMVEEFLVRRWNNTPPEAGILLG